ncbi:hypothetical protein [Vibrio sp. SCSIO 43136]|uniref:hypothetical protein n=1 Tax=Vibrio sp. SCSIO 43136 TaxID=2819101 RepID=UPI002075DC76|nr:hypothetical protein [Vibrio sp. SCSIO 43136]USD67521.1 hypothetical protein J4N39_15060 [Vibrio sp. SCSIO 43136]
MVFSLEPEVVQLGMMGSLAEVISLESQPEVVEVNGESVVSVFAFPSDFPPASTISMDAEYLFVLLSEGSKDQQRDEYLRTLQRLPQIPSTIKVLVFPYGACAMQLALRQAQRIFAMGDTLIKVVAFHQDAYFQSDIAFSPDHPMAGSTQSECFFSANLAPSSQGFGLLWSSYEVQTADKPMEQPIEALFSRYRRNIGLPLAYCFVPSQLDDCVQKACMESIRHLKSCITAQSQILLPDAAVGSLGPCSGMYHLWQLQNQLINHEISGANLTLDISSERYRSASAYQWIGTNTLGV